MTSLFSDPDRPDFLLVERIDQNSHQRQRQQQRLRSLDHAFAGKQHVDLIENHSPTKPPRMDPMEIMTTVIASKRAP